MARRHRIAWVILLVTLLVGCATRPAPRPPVPAPPPAPPAELITFEVFVHDLVTPARGLDGVAATCGTETRTTNGDGTAHFDVPAGAQLDCRFDREGYEQQRASALPCRPDEVDGCDRRLTAWMARVYSPLAPLHVEGNARWFATPAGRFDYREISAFSLLSRLLVGEEPHVVEYLRAIRAQGFTVARVILTLDGDYWSGRGPIRRSFRSAPDMPGYWEALDRLALLTANERVYLRAVFIGALEAFGGTWFPDRRDVYTDAVKVRTEAFVLEAAGRLGGYPHVIGELANEPGQIGMRESFDDLITLGRAVKARAPGMLLGGGAVDGPNDQDTRLCVAPFDYCDAHIERRMEVGGFEWVKRTGEYAPIDQDHVAARMPFISGEPVNFGEWRADGWNTDVERSPSVAFAYGAVSRARQYNTTFHYDGGLWTTLPQPDTAASIACYMAALDGFPMGTDSKWRGNWSVEQGNYWNRNAWPSSDDTRDVEQHVASGRGPWRAFGAGLHSVLFPEPRGWNWAANLVAPAERVATCEAGTFPASVYRRR